MPEKANRQNRQPELANTIVLGFHGESPLGWETSWEIGARVKTFQLVNFEKGKWDSKVNADGSTTYTAKEDDSHLEVVHELGGASVVQKHTYKKGKEVRVTGSSVSLPEE